MELDVPKMDVSSPNGSSIGINIFPIENKIPVSKPPTIATRHEGLASGNTLNSTLNHVVTTNKEISLPIIALSTELVIGATSPRY